MSSDHKSGPRQLAKPLLLLAGLLPQGFGAERRDVRKADSVPLGCCEAFELPPVKARESGNLSSARTIYSDVTRIIGSVVKSRGARRHRRRTELASEALETFVLDSNASTEPAIGPLTPSSTVDEDSLQNVTVESNEAPSMMPFRWGAGGSIIADILAAGGTALRQTFLALQRQLNRSVTEDVTFTAVAFAGAVGALGVAGNFPAGAARQLLSSSRAGHPLPAGAAPGDLFGAPLGFRPRARTQTDQSEGAPASPPTNWWLRAFGACCVLFIGGGFYLLLARLQFPALLKLVLKGRAAVSQSAASR